MVLEHGHVAGPKGVLLSEDGGTHQNDLGAGDTGLKGHTNDFSHTTEPVKACLLGLWMSF